MRILTLGATCTLVGCGSLTQYTTEDELDGSGVEPAAGGDRGANVDGDGDGVKGRDDCDDDDDTVFPGAHDRCGDDVDADCDGEDCLGWEEDFESGTLRPAWVVDGNVGWSVWSTASRHGTWSAVSGAIIDSQASHLGLVVDLPQGGAVSFWHSGSTETSFDLLRFAVDGVEVGAWSGTWGWQEDTFEIPAGTHNVRWSYTKDISQSLGQDTVLIDDVLIEGGNP